MIKLGEYNTLEAARSTDNGFYLKDEDGNEVLLPNKYVPEGFENGAKLDVFIFKDSEDRLTATTATPKIKLNRFAYLKVNQVNNVGAFLDWGLEKDLLVPYSEQNERMVKDNSYLVHMYIDKETERLVASGKLRQFFKNEDCTLDVGDEVDLLIGERNYLGIEVIINELYGGLIYKNEIFKKVQRGDKKKGYIKLIREDYKIDVALQPQGYKNQDASAEKILSILKENEGYLNLNDKSSPELIKARLEMSKKTFKKSIGALYKARLIDIKKDGVYLV